MTPRNIFVSPRSQSCHCPSPPILPVVLPRESPLGKYSGKVYDRNRPNWPFELMCSICGGQSLCHETKRTVLNDRYLVIREKGLWCIEVKCGPWNDAKVIYVIEGSGWNYRDVEEFLPPGSLGQVAPTPAQPNRYPSDIKVDDIIPARVTFARWYPYDLW